MSFFQCPDNFSEAVEACFQIFDDFLGQFIGFGKVIQVGQAFVLKPKDIQAGFVAGNDLFIGVFAPPALRVLFLAPCLFPLVPVLGIETGDKVLQILKPEGFLFQGVVDIR